MKKAISFELISNAAGLLAAYAIFGNIGNCLAFTFGLFIFKVALFQIHEVFWEKLSK
jgi:uncharacterized membrane protein